MRDFRLRTTQRGVQLLYIALLMALALHYPQLTIITGLFIENIWAIIFNGDKVLLLVKVIVFFVPIMPWVVLKRKTAFLELIKKKLKNCEIMLYTNHHNTGDDLHCRGKLRLGCFWRSWVAFYELEKVIWDTCLFFLVAALIKPEKANLNTKTLIFFQHTRFQFWAHNDGF